MDMEYVVVRFPGRRGYYRVAINTITEEAVWRLETNPEDYHDVVIEADADLLWRYARPVSRDAEDRSRKQTRLEQKQQRFRPKRAEQF